MLPIGRNDCTPAMFWISDSFGISIGRRLSVPEKMEEQGWHLSTFGSCHINSCLKGQLWRLGQLCRSQSEESGVLQVGILPGLLLFNSPRVFMHIVMSNYRSRASPRCKPKSAHVNTTWSLHCYLNFCYEIFLLVTRSSQKNARFNRKCSRHPRKCNLLPAIRSSFEFALVCAFLRRFALVLHFFCTCLGPFWRQLDPGDQENTAEWDFCPNRQKALGSEWEAKSATSSQFWYRTRGEAEIYATMEVPGRVQLVGT